ncbi:hypothetical protein GIB67_016449 [Kingdonia uniflora]|uniref:Uncharacterized protein n=1 Tax=Kingdonia uniflora TaxID=39325 RepID=A0A7J7MH48_9MAGN|nr:hypothetical protein GIB67_016449 [Kingdonia uniflora]
MIEEMFPRSPGIDLEDYQEFVFNEPDDEPDSGYEDNPWAYMVVAVPDAEGIFSFRQSAGFVSDGFVSDALAWMGRGCTELERLDISGCGWIHHSDEILRIAHNSLKEFIWGREVKLDYCLQCIGIWCDDNECDGSDYEGVSVDQLSFSLHLSYRKDMDPPIVTIEARMGDAKLEVGETNAKAKAMAKSEVVEQVSWTSRELDVLSLRKESQTLSMSSEDGIECPIGVARRASQ